MYVCVYTYVIFLNFLFYFFALGQLLQVVRAANGAQYIFQPQQSVVLQQQVIPQMQPGGVQAPVIQQVKHVTILWDPFAAAAAAFAAIAV